MICLPRQLACLVMLSCVTLFGIAATTAASQPSDSEQRLIQRREQRVRQLPAPPTPPRISAAVTHPIDSFVAAKWRTLHTPAKVSVCDDATFLRRVHLDITGVIPTLKETNRFLASKAGQEKRRQWIDELLNRNEDYAAHWTVFWEDALASQSVLDQGGVLTRGNYRNWLLSSFRRNRPYDVLVAELIDPSMPGRQAARSKDVFGITFDIEYVRSETHTVALQTAANIGQVFLGTAMKCASCHDHFDNPEWPQDRFLAFAGMFAKDDLEKLRCDVKIGQTIPASFPFKVADAQATIPDSLDERLHLAADLLTDPANPRFAKTIVNRLWKRYFGLGLFEPADDYRDDTQASHPELLEWLAHDFLANGCDLKHTTRLILTSQTYQLGYDPQLADTFDPSNPSERYLRSPSLRRLTAEQILDSIRLAATGELRFEQRTFLDARSTALMRSLGRPASRNEISTARSDDVAIVQALELLNGEELHRMIQYHVQPESGRVDERRLVDRLYRTVLSRPATTEERNTGREHLLAAGSPAEGLTDLFWALVCSPEFQYLR